MLRFVVALPCEARPIIHHYRLREIETRPFRVYAREEVRLIVSGIGQLASATAAGYLQGLSPEESNSVWLNVGVAGHATAQIGELFAVHKIRETASLRAAFPVFVGKPTCQSADLSTVDEAERDYDDDRLYDMEGAGFYQAASKFTSAELVHILKVVSDNRESSVDELNQRFVEDLLKSRVDEIAGFAQDLQPLSRELTSIQKAPASLSAITERVPMSVTQTRRLRQLLGRLETLDRLPSLEILLAFERGSPLLAHLEGLIDAAPPRLVPKPWEEAADG